jgi:ubiquinone biosynthesis protein
VPGLLSRAGTLFDQFDAITRDGLVLAPETVAAIGAAERRANRWRTWGLWAIAALLAGLLLTLWS